MADAGLQGRSAAEIRDAFIRYFADRHAHTVVPSSPSVPHDDPTLLFANAGMNQFKPCFLGTTQAGSPLHGLKRAVNSQKCIRAGGKHNDLDDVGLDTYHHTFFEMLGNWSFGDFFKAEAIEWAWDFLTGVCGLGPDRLYATYFEGDPAQGLEPDHEARDLWLRHLPPERVLPFDAKDNFWEMGDVGPCGPCSELHYDRIGSRDAASLVNRDDPDVIEIWNLVFIQFNKEKVGDSIELKPLPAKHVDTGMGLERLVSVLQDKPSNYDTDLFTPIFAEIQKVTGFDRPYGGKLGDDDPDRVDMAYRVIADHIRTLVVAITDGATPSNEGRGYVLRRVLRRAVRFGRQMLNAETGFLTDLVPIVGKTLGEGFPELRANTAKVAEIIAEEEASFGKTLDKGLRVFYSLAADAFVRTTAVWLREQDKFLAVSGWGIPDERLDEELNEAPGMPKPVNAEASSDIQIFEKSVDGKMLDEFRVDQMNKEHISRWTRNGVQIRGDHAFMLYDTYGFPLDLTQMMAAERGLTVDVAGFEAAMEQQRERSRAGSKFGSGESRLRLEPDALAKLAHMSIAPTDDGPKYEPRDTRGRVRAIWNGRNFDEHVDAGSSGLKQFGVVLDRTGFYAEAGGQVADVGRLLVLGEHRRDAGSHRQSEFKVEDVQRFGDYVLHIGRLVKGTIRVGEEVECRLDRNRRARIQANHTATHLVNLGLKTHLGDGVDQKGSLVDDTKLRFDFSYGKPVEPGVLAAIETDVRAAIAADLPLSAKVAPLYVAKSINGLRAVFGETYPDPVRVVAIGAEVDAMLDAPEDERWASLSSEFCGGTHLTRAGEAEAFALVQETGVAKGIRRVEAVTGDAAREAIKAGAAIRSRIDAAAALPDDRVATAVGELSAAIDQGRLSVSDAASLREALGSLQGRAKAAAKAAAVAARQRAVEEAKQLAASASADLREVIVASLPAGEDRQALQAALQVIADKCPAAAVLLASASDERVALIAQVPDAMIKRGLKAGDWIRAAAEACGGKGGGKPNQAQGGGTEPAKLRGALETAERFAAKTL
ncbi:MAG: alanine--tRNA ligase [Planctomycetota bacterium]